MGKMGKWGKLRSGREDKIGIMGNMGYLYRKIEDEEEDGKTVKKKINDEIVK